MTIQVSLRQLHYFVTVAEELHFRRAAERLFLSQPALSHQIARLEGEVGVRLLDRDRHRVALTAAGVALLDGARQTLAQAEHAVAGARWAGGITSHGLRVGYPAYCARTVHRILASFSARHPEVWIEERQMPTVAQLQAMAERTLDVGFVHPPVGGGLAVEALLNEELAVMLPATHPLAPRPSVPLAALRGETILMPPLGTMAWYIGHITARCRLAGFEPRVSRLPDAQPFRIQALMSLVAEGAGVYLLAGVPPRAIPAEVVFRPVEQRSPAVKLAVAWPREHPSPFIADFLGAAREATRLPSAARL